MKPVDFDYVKPNSVEDAVVALSEAAGEGKVIAGGQSLMPLLNMRLARPKVLVDISGLPFDIIEDCDETVRIGANVRQCDIEPSALVKKFIPLLIKAMPYVGHQQTRNRGTVVGSIAHADPSGEIPLVACMLDAVLEISSPSGNRQVPINEFYYGYLLTALQTDEIITGILFPKQNKFNVNSGSAFTEMSRRHGDFALVSAACHLELDVSGVITDKRLGLGGVDAVPLRLLQLEHELTGKVLSKELTHNISLQVKDLIEPEDDLNATADYRKFVAAKLIERVLNQAHAEAVHS